MLYRPYPSCMQCNYGQSAEDGGPPLHITAATDRAWRVRETDQGRQVRGGALTRNDALEIQSSSGPVPDLPWLVHSSTLCLEAVHIGRAKSHLPIGLGKKNVRRGLCGTQSDIWRCSFSP